MRCNEAERSNSPCAISQTEDGRILTIRRDTRVGAILMLELFKENADSSAPEAFLAPLYASLIRPSAVTHGSIPSRICFMPT